MSEDNARFDRGVAKIREIGGSFEAIFAAVADVAPDLSRFVAEFAFGDLYCRAGLEPVQRQLLTIVALTVQGDSAPQLKFHVHVALNVGASPELIVETVLHTLAFTGFPRVVNAMRVARDVFESRALLPVDTSRNAPA